MNCVICGQSDIEKVNRFGYKDASGDGVTCVGCYWQLWKPQLKCLFVVDDAHPPGHETLHSAWKRLTGKGWDHNKAVLTQDHGDAVTYYFEDGWVAVGSCEGGEIYRHKSFLEE